MPKKRAIAESSRPVEGPPQPFIYRGELTIPVMVIAFEQEQAAERILGFVESLSALVSAVGDQGFQLDDGKLRIVGAEPLPLNREGRE